MRTLSLAIAAALLTAISLWAQQPNSNNDQQMQGMQNMQGMQMNKGQTMQHGQKMSQKQMMQDCHKNMQAMAQSNDQATKEIEAAKQSNDPAKMRAALDTAEKALAGTNDHMKGCQSMMDMMQRMQGMDGMMSGQKKHNQQTTPPKQ